MTQASKFSYKSDPCSFIGHYQQLVKDTVVPFQYDILHDQAEGAEKSHVIQNFENAAKALAGEDPADGFYGMVFQDSDAAKWIEAASYSLISIPDEALQRKIKKVVDLVVAAQDQDGYLNTYFTIKDRDRRFTNLQEGHELYCSGHMMEAAVAYYEATGDDILLQAMLRNTDCIYHHFITEGHPGYPGHPEVELALLKLYQVTGYERALELARHFIDVRGVDPDYYKKEAAARDWSVWGADPGDPAYMQADLPVRKQSQAKGHSVRAVYLYTAMAHLAELDHDDELSAAAARLWDNITGKRMYITGGIGSTVHGEAFSVDYDLPSDTAYCETCASIGLMFFARKMVQLDPDSRYSDVSERAFYNTVLAGMSLDGKSFFYVNPLEVDPGISAMAPTHRHDLTRRFHWHACACCPPNTARIIASFGKYAFGTCKDRAYVHLYAAGEVTFENGLSLSIQTKYPAEHTISFTVTEEGNGQLAIRIPGYARGYSLTINGSPCDIIPKKGYIYLSVLKSDQIRLTLEVQIEKNYASIMVPRLSGLTALSYGPLVYCFEEADNPSLYGLHLREGATPILHVDHAAANSSTPVSETAAPFIRIGELTLPRISILALQKSTPASSSDALYFTTPPLYERACATAIPYFTWGNRQEGAMKVWMPER